MYINLHFEPHQIQKQSYVTMNINDLSFPVLCIDKDSYIVGAVIETALNYRYENKLYNFQIGRHSAIAENILFMIDLDHDYKAVYQGIISELSFSNKNQNPTNDKHWTKLRKGEISICNDCWIGNGATIMNGVIIHNGAVVAAKSVVTKSVPPYTIVGGNPAKIIAKRFDDEIIQALKIIQWWNWDSNRLIDSKKYLDGDVKEFVKKFYPEAKEELIKSSETNPYFDKVIDDGKVYVYIVDDDTTVSSYAYVINQFCNRFHNMDSQLVLFFSDSLPNKELSVQSVMHELNKYEDFDCCIDIVTESSVTIESLINHSDAYITSRSSQNIRAIGIAELFGKDVVSAFNIPMIW